MDFIEVIILLISGFFSVKFLIKWYSTALWNVHLGRSNFPRVLLCLMPVFSFVIIAYTLISLASFDVVDSGIYVIFYILIGFAWLYLGTLLMFYLFDLSWIDDVVGMNNPAAALIIFAGDIGITLIYAGANIGDGPGWWCVFFAGGMGFIAWFILGALANAATNVFRRVTVGRDIFCGIRTSAYFVASGILLGRASAGDWTSAAKTITEFGDGWPVLPLTVIFILVELIFSQLEKQGENSGKALKWMISLILAAAYVAAAIYALQIVPPLPVNPMYQ